MPFYLLESNCSKGFYMVVRKFLLLGLIIGAFCEVMPHRADYTDLDVAQNTGSNYLLDAREWVSGEFFGCKIGKTIRSVSYCLPSDLIPGCDSHYSVDLHIWYPNALDTTAVFLTFPYRENDIESRRKQLLKRGFSHKDVFDLDSLCCHAGPNSPFSSRSICPLVFFCPGDLGTSAGDYTAICEKLAGKGYVVVAIESRFNKISVADVNCAYNHLMKYNCTKDDMFYNQLDFDRVGIIGHLHGGSIAYELCITKDDRFNAGASMDGMPFSQANARSKMPESFMFLFSEEKIHQARAIQVDHSQVSIIPQLKSQGFSDLLLLKDFSPYKNNKHLLDLEALTGTAEGVKTITLINQYLVDFFAHSLAA